MWYNFFLGNSKHELQHTNLKQNNSNCKRIFKTFSFLFLFCFFFRFILKFTLLD